MTSLLPCEAQRDFILKYYHVSIYQLYNKYLICTSFGGIVWKNGKRMFDFSLGRRGEKNIYIYIYIYMYLSNRISNILKKNSA